MIMYLYGPKMAMLDSILVVLSSDCAVYERVDCANDAQMNDLYSVERICYVRV